MAYQQKLKTGPLSEICLQRFSVDVPIVAPETFTLEVPILAADDVARVVFVAPFACEVVSVREMHEVVGGAGATVTIEKLTGTTAPASGTALLTAALDLTSTVNTLLTGTKTATAADLVLAAGNRIGVKLAGTLGSLTGALSIEFKKLTGNSAVNRPVWIAPIACQVMAVREIHSVVGSTSAAVNLEKLAGVTAPAAGAALLTTALDLTTTANTVQSGTLSAAEASLQFDAGDVLGLNFTGNLLGLAGRLSVEFKEIDV